MPPALRITVRRFAYLALGITSGAAACWLFQWSAATNLVAADADATDAVPATITCTGVVQDALYGKPLAGAHVTIRKLASPQRYRDGDATVLQRFEAVTDAEGKFNFTLPTDHAFDPMESLTTSSSGRAASARSARNGATFSSRAGRSTARGRGFARPGSFVFIPLEIDATQPNYAPCRISMSVYPVMLPDPYYQGDGFATPPEKHDPAQRSIGVLELRPGKEVTGVVQSPDGKPLTGAKVLAHSVVPKNEREIPGVSRSQQPRPADEQTQTDADGRFRVTMITPGEGMLEIYPAKDFAPLYKNVYDERGDVGVLKVSPGTEIKGRVLDAEGKPVPRVFIQVSSSDQYFNSYYDFFADRRRTRRAAESNAQGEFTIAGLAAGVYRLEPSDSFDDATVDLHDQPDHRPLQGIYIPQKITITAGQPLPRLELRAIPSVTVEGYIILDETAFGAGAAESRMQTAMRNGQLAMHGTYNDLPYRKQLQFDEDGNFKLIVPKGLREAGISPLTLNGQQMPQWRIGSEAPYSREQQIDLGVVDDNIREIEINYSRATARNGAAAPRPAREGAAVARGARATISRGANAAIANDVAPQPAAKPAEIIATGSVIDADSGQPIEGAKIALWEFELGGDGGPKYLRHRDTLSDTEGKYHFSISTDHAKTLPDGRTVINVETAAKHSDYVAPSSPRPQVLEVEIPTGMAAGRRRSVASLPETINTPVVDALRAAPGQPRRDLRPIEMIPATETTGVLQSPEGRPVSGVRAYVAPTAPIGRLEKERLRSAPNQPLVEESINEQNQVGVAVAARQMRGYGADDTVTDDAGRFRFMLPTTGECELSIWPAKDFVPQSQQLHERRGDLGAMTLRRGPVVKGRVVDSEGNPLAGIYLEATKVDAEKKSVADTIFRATMSDSEGRFAFAPLPEGDFRIEPRDSASDLTTEHRHDPPPEKHPLPGFFRSQKVSLSGNREVAPLEFRVITPVSISGHIAIDNELLDGVVRFADLARTNPFVAQSASGNFSYVPSAVDAPNRATVRAQFAPILRGILNEFPFEAKATIDDEGNFAIKAPHGLSDAVVVLLPQHSATPSAVARRGNGPAMTSTTTVQPQWRVDREKPLVTGGEIPLGKVGEGVSNIEVVYSDPGRGTNGK